MMKMAVKEHLQEKLDSLPASPGVYLMKDAKGKVIYVGKASVLKNRVRSYFQGGAARNPWLSQLVRQIQDIDIIVTRSEKEALILEGNLIKMHRPPFNIRFKDDKRFPYIKIRLDDPYPALMVVRNPTDDKALYFGPYVNARAMWETIDLIKRIFGLRVITMVGDRRASGCPWRDTSKFLPRACLEYFIYRCAGPCVQAISQQEHAAIVREVRAFLEGKLDSVLGELKRQMWEAAEKEEFEKAAKLRDQIRAIEWVVEQQTVVLGFSFDIDCYAYAHQAGIGCLQMLKVRGGKLLDKQSFLLQVEEGRPPAELIGAFIKQHYSLPVHIPKTVLLPVDLEDSAVIAEWLSDKRGEKVDVHVPERGQLRKLMEIAEENAKQALRAELERAETERKVTEETLASLQRHLNLPKPPQRIECFDISNIQGRQAVGSMVVFDEGKPAKKEYRRFKIKTHQGQPDDYEMMREVLRRRFKRMIDGDEKFATPPDLLMVDGGKGQLGCALEVLKEFGAEHIPACGLAKEHELIYVPNSSLPIALPYNSPALHLLQRVRNEAHRFAITHHRQRRTQTGLRSILDDAPGIGEVRKRALLQHFGSLDAIKAASVDELCKVPTMTRTAAEQLWRYLHPDS